MRNISFSPPDVGEAELEGLKEVIASKWLTTGKKTAEFEQRITDYTDSYGTVCLNSATSALELALRYYGIGEGDEVITTPYTYTATAAVIAHVGAKIVFADVKKDTCFIDAEKISSLITEKTKAIIPVDIAGAPVDYDEIIKCVISEKGKFKPRNVRQEIRNRVLLLADSAHSFGASYKGRKLGSVADLTAFSFHAVKNLTTGEGGALAFSDVFGEDEREIYRTLTLMSLQGQTKSAFEKAHGGYRYDVELLGYKYNMTDLQAAIGLKQMERYKTLIRKREELFSVYKKCLSGSSIELFNHPNGETHSVYHLALARIEGANEETRDRLIERLRERGISTNVHFVPLPMFTAYKNLGYDINNYPNAYDYYRNEITLPLHTLLSTEDVGYVCDSIKEILK